MHDDIYELHVAESGRWHLQERFRGTQKDEAVEEAKRQFASPSIEAVRVILEKYDETEQLFKQRTIYRQSKQKVAPPVNAPVAAPPPRRIAAPPRVAPVSRTAQARPLGTAASVLASSSPPPPKPAAQPEEEAGPSLASRLMMSGLIALVLSGLGVLLLTGVLGGENGPLASVDPLFIYLLSVLVFAAAFWISLQMFSRTGGRRAARALVDDETETPEATPASAQPPQASSTSPPSGEAAQPMSAAEQTRFDAAQKAIEERGLAAMNLGGSASAQGSVPPAPTPSTPVAAALAPEETTAEEKAPTEKTEPSVTPFNGDYLLTFLRDSLVHPSMQPFTGNGLDGRNRFACHLFMLGAAEAVLTKTKGSAKELPILIGGALGALGTTADRAGTFLARVADYHRDEKFGKAIEAGRAAMVSEAAQKTLDIAILFTDLVASVATTQRIGEEQAMRLVQNHNQIVAVALKRNRGHQVKHTGDGIMAVFPRVADGLAAAVYIQRQCQEHNQVTPGEQILLRIGLSAGQPVQENNDYFGTIVQLSARLSSLGEPGDIHCDAIFADYVKENVVAPLSAPFDVPLKGFAQQQTVYRVEWQNDAPIAEASE
jgi:class 3 adenylate cyclase